MTTAAMLFVVALSFIGIVLLFVNHHLSKKVDRLEQELRALKDKRIIDNANAYVNDFLPQTH